MKTIPEPDRIDGVKHPNETSKVFGHDVVTSKFLQAFKNINIINIKKVTIYKLYISLTF